MTRNTYGSGATKESNQDKPRFDLIPIEPMFRVALRYTEGAKKYSERNWEKGIPVSQYVSSALRHLYQYLAGDRSEDHLAAVIFNIMAIMHHEEKIKKGVLDKSYYDIEGEPFK